VSDVKSLRDLCYATVDGVDLCLDLHVPAAADAPLVVYAHGGGFSLGDKGDAEQERLIGLAEHGVAVASIDYRFAPNALYPAQIHDMKAAIRWLRGHGGSSGLQTGRIGAWGASAGGYLASMVALSAGDSDLEGGLGHSDRVVPAQESAALHDALGRVGVASTLTYLAGAGHEDPAFDRPEFLAMTAAWLRSVLLGEKSSR
jgi:acetyl esterase/lipase